MDLFLFLYFTFSFLFCDGCVASKTLWSIRIFDYILYSEWKETSSAVSLDRVLYDMDALIKW